MGGVGNTILLVNFEVSRLDPNDLLIIQSTIDYLTIYVERNSTNNCYTWIIFIQYLAISIFLPNWTEGSPLSQIYSPWSLGDDRLVWWSAKCIQNVIGGKLRSQICLSPAKAPRRQEKYCFWKHLGKVLYRTFTLSANEYDSGEVQKAKSCTNRATTRVPVVYVAFLFHIGLLLEKSRVLDLWSGNIQFL